MNRLQCKILLAMLSLAVCVANAQVPAPDEIWGGITHAAEVDILSNAITQREKNRAAVTESITNQLKELHGVLDKPYSFPDINSALDSIVLIISNPGITEAQASDAERLYTKLINYESVANELYSRLILEYDNKAFDNTITILGMDTDEMSGGLVEVMSGEIKVALENNGLYKMAIDKDYTYLNKMLKYVKDNLALLVGSNSADTDQLISQLRTVLNTVNEISPEFPKVEIILDHDFKTDNK